MSDPCGLIVSFNHFEKNEDDQVLDWVNCGQDGYRFVIPVFPSEYESLPHGIALNLGLEHYAAIDGKPIGDDWSGSWPYGGAEFEGKVQPMIGTTIPLPKN